MALEILACEQGSPEWFAARLGLPTASEFGTVMAKGVQKDTASKTRKTYMYKLAGERITKEPMESYSNADMQRGKDQENAAGQVYSFLTDAELDKVGFIHDPELRTGCSPDALVVGARGAVEIKCKSPHVLIEAINQDRFCPEHIPQCQGTLWITGRQWIDLVCYCPKMPLFVKRAYRDEPYIVRLAEEVAAFNFELDQVVRMIERYGEEKAA